MTAATVTARVLVVTNMWPTASDPAFGVFVMDQVAALRRLGLDIDVLFVDGRSGAWRYAAGVFALRRRLARATFDLVHAHHALSGLVVWLSRGPTRMPPWLLTHHGIEVFEGWQAPLARWLTHRADRTLVVSRPMAERLGLPPSCVQPMGIDLGLFRPGDRAASRRALGLPRDAPLVAWVGANRPEKRLSLARESVAALQRRVPSAELVVVSGVDHRDVPRWLAASDVLLLTSTREGGPLVVKEALACNRPVVSTDVGDVREVVAGVVGCAIAAPVPAALADALQAALAHGPVRGRQAVARYDVRRVAERLTDVYRAMASPDSRGECPGAGRS